MAYSAHSAVGGAAAVKPAVLDLAAQRVVLPAVADGDDVQVGQYAQGLFAGAVADVSGVAVDVPGLKAEAPPVLKGDVQHPAHVFAEGRVFSRGFRLDRGNGDPLAYIFDQFVPIGIDEAVEDFVVHFVTSVEIEHRILR